MRIRRIFVVSVDAVIVCGPSFFFFVNFLPSRFRGSVVGVTLYCTYKSDTWPYHPSATQFQVTSKSLLRGKRKRTQEICHVLSPTKPSTNSSMRSLTAAHEDFVFRS